MKIGIDIDNTIINYDDSFFREAKKIVGLENMTGGSKSEIKLAVENAVGESGWTEMQGNVYAKAPLGLKIFKGFDQFLTNAVRLGSHIFYISHKTKFPILGPRIELRAPIYDFMKKKHLLHPHIKGATIQFHDSQDEKIQAVKSLNLDFFIDDLVEIVDILQNDCAPLHFMCTCNKKNHLGFKDWANIDQFINKQN